MVSEVHGERLRSRLDCNMHRPGFGALPLRQIVPDRHESHGNNNLNGAQGNTR